MPRYQAVEYYERAKNLTDMAESFYHLEDYESLKKLVDKLPDGDPLLEKIGDMFASDSVHSMAVKTYLKVWLDLLLLKVYYCSQYIIIHRVLLLMVYYCNDILYI